jgi:CheY-like chemotaxis protein
LDLESERYSAVRDALKQVLESSRSAVDTVKRLQSFSGVQDDARGGEIGVYDLSGLVEEAVEMCEAWWKTAPETQGIQVSLIKRLSDECLIKGERTLLFEVIVNLLKNAAEAVMQANGGDIEIRTMVQEEWVVLQVADSGIGMSEQNVERLFNPFFTTKAEFGAGLGMASTRKIVEEHGGRILVESHEGKGSTFTVTFPHVAQTPQNAEHLSPKPPEQTLTVLAVDDEEAIVKLVKASFSREGHKVLVATSAEEALQLFDVEGVSVVICDLGMPGMNGWQLGKAIKQVCDQMGVPKTPFIILTGWSDQTSEAGKIRESGVDAVVRKPLNMDRLLEVAREVASKASRER